MSSFRPAGPFRPHATGGDNRPFSIRDQIGAPGQPSQGETSTKFPRDGHMRMFTHESAYEEPVEIFNRAFIAFFDKLDPLVQLVLPIYPFDGEAVTINEFISKVRPFGPHGHQGPHETFGMQMTQQKFQLQWLGLMFALDNSILNTPLDQFLVSAHTKTLQACMNMTVFIEVINHIVDQPNIYFREFELNTRKKANPMTELQAAERVVDIMEILPGILDKGDSYENAFGYLLEHSGNMLDVFRVSPGLRPTFLLMASWIANTLKTTNEAVDSKVSETHIQQYLKTSLNRDDIVWDVHPLAVSRFNGLSVLKIDAYDSTEGMRDPLARVWINGEAWRINPSEMWRFQIIDYEKRAWVTVFEHGTEAERRRITPDTLFKDQWKEGTANVVFASTPFNTAAKVFATKQDAAVAAYSVAPTYILALRPNVANMMQEIVHGIGGPETGITAIGRETHSNYMVPQIDRREWQASIRLGVFVMHEEHFMCVPNAKHYNYIRGGSAKLAQYVTVNSATIVPGNQSTYFFPDPVAGTPRSAYYGESGLVGPNSRRKPNATSGDVFMYWVPADSTELVANARMVCAGGTFSETTHLHESATYKWLYNPAYSTNLTPRGGADKMRIEEHGLGGNLNQICWMSKGRYFQIDSKPTEPIYTGDGSGPWRTFGLDAMDIFQNMPRRRIVGK